MIQMTEAQLAARSPPLVAIPGRPQRPVVLITGCSSGIGRGRGRRFARAGYRVYASMRRPEAGGGAARRGRRPSGWTLDTPALDVTSDTSVERRPRRAGGDRGPHRRAGQQRRLLRLRARSRRPSPDELRAQLETNVVGVLRVTRAVLPAMRARGQGRIVNLSSISGRGGDPGAPAAYHASKWALEALTEALRYEVAAIRDPGDAGRAWAVPDRPARQAGPGRGAPRSAGVALRAADERLPARGRQDPAGRPRRRGRDDLPRGHPRAGPGCAGRWVPPRSRAASCAVSSPIVCTNGASCGGYFDSRGRGDCRSSISGRIMNGGVHGQAQSA